MPSPSPRRCGCVDVEAFTALLRWDGLEVIDEVL